MFPPSPPPFPPQRDLTQQRFRSQLRLRRRKGQDDDDDVDNDDDDDDEEAESEDEDDGDDVVFFGIRLFQNGRQALESSETVHLLLLVPLFYSTSSCKCHSSRQRQ